MGKSFMRVGTTYLPVLDVQDTADWYVNNLGAKLNYVDDEKAILDLANQSFFLVMSKEGEHANFYTAQGQEHFSCTFEVNGLDTLEAIHKEFQNKRIQVGSIEDRGHVGRNFVFQDPNGNKFDVWSELSSEFKERYDVR